MTRPGQSILVTGDSGFVGQHLMRRLSRMGHQVIGYRRRCPSGDIAAPGAFDDLLEDTVDVVVHLAAKTYVPESWTANGDFERTNIGGTSRLLDYCARRQVRLIHMSSYVYGQPVYLPIDELHPTTPTNPYAVSKLKAERLCRRHATDHGLAVTVFRPGNIYGPGQDDRFLIPSILRQLRTGGPIELADPAPRRDMVHVDDVVHAISLAVERPHTGFGLFNLGSGRSHSVVEIATLLAELAEFDGPITYLHRTRPHEIADVVLDCRQAGVQLGWSTSVDLRQGLTHLVEHGQRIGQPAPTQAVSPAGMS